MVTVYEKNNFVFQSNSKEEMRVVLWGEPEQTGELSFPAQGIKINLTFEADTVNACVATYTSQNIKFA